MAKQKRTYYVITLVGEEWFRILLQPDSRNRLYIIPVIADRTGMHLTVISEGHEIATHRSTTTGTERHVRGEPGPRSKFSKSYVGRHIHKYHFNRRAFVPTQHYFNVAQGKILEGMKETLIFYEIVRPVVELADPFFFHSERLRDVQLMYPGYGFVERHGGVSKATPLDDHFALFEPISQTMQFLEGVYPFDEIVKYMDDLEPETLAYLKRRMIVILKGRSQAELAVLVHELQSSRIAAKFAASTNTGVIKGR